MSPRAILDATRNPTRVFTRRTYRGLEKHFIGQDATVILNSSDKIITTWGKSRW